MNRSTAAAAIATGLAAAVTFTPTLATAAPSDDVAVVKDAAGDIDSGVDLLRGRLANREAVRVWLRHDDLVAEPEHAVGVSIWLDTDRAAKGPEYLFLAGLYTGTDYTLVEADGWKAGKPVAMKDCFYRLRLDYAKDRSKVRIDPGCLGGAEEVRVAVKAGADTDEGTRKDWLGGRRSFTPWV